MARVINVGSENRGGGAFEPIPAGTKLKATVYAIEEAEVKSGDNAGKSQLVLTFKVQGGQYNGREIRYVNVPLYDGPGAWKLVTFAEAVGWETQPNVVLPDNLQSVLGTALVIKVSLPPARTPGGTQYNNVSGFAKVDSVTDNTPVASQDAAPSWGALNGG